MRWHVFYTSINAEAIAEEAIGALGYKTFVPFEKRIRRLPNQKPREYRTAYFPRYGFVAFAPDSETWPEILGGKGVLGILRNNGAPMPVADRIIDALKVADSVGLFDKTKPPTIGMVVTVTCGPFSGLLGKIMRARTGDRMDVLLKMFNSETTATIPLMALREFPG